MNGTWLAALARRLGAALGGLFRPREMPAPIVPDLSSTAPPVVSDDGDTACSGCDAVVPFATMTIDERGYFCPGCARRSSR